jgi:hypothetical protein
MRLFYLSIFFLLGFAAILIIPIYLHETSCIQKSQDHTITGTTANHSNVKEPAAVALDKKGRKAAAEIKITKQQKVGSADYLFKEETINKFGESLICEEIKITDLALVFFTYCLVLVAYFQLRSNEYILKESERAHVFANLKGDVIGTNAQISISAVNTGRSPCIIKGIVGKFSKEIPTIWSNYSGSKKFDYDISIAPNQTFVPHLPASFTSPAANNIFFYGYIYYEDIFQERHQSRFCLKLDFTTGQTVSCGPRKLNKTV